MDRNGTKRGQVPPPIEPRVNVCGANRPEIVRRRVHDSFSTMAKRLCWSSAARHGLFAVGFNGEPALRRSGRSLFQIAVESALDIDLQEARQQSVSCHFLKGLRITLVELLGQDDDAPKIKRLFNGSGSGVLNVKKRLKIARFQDSAVVSH